MIVAFNKNPLGNWENELLEDYSNDLETRVKNEFDSLAGALNFIGNTRTIPGEDANNITQSGIYVVAPGSENARYSYGVLLHLRRDALSGAQIVVDISQSRMSVRSSRNANGVKVWNEWVTL